MHVYLVADLSLKSLSVPKLASKKRGSVSPLLTLRARYISQGVSRHPATKLSQRAPLQPKSQDLNGDVPISYSLKWPPAEPPCPPRALGEAARSPFSTWLLYYLRTPMQLARHWRAASTDCRCECLSGARTPQQLGSTFLASISQGQSQK